MKKEIIFISIIVGILIFISIFFSMPELTRIQIDTSDSDITCKSFSLDISENLKDVKKQMNLCELKCGEFDLTLSSSSCRNNELNCNCGSEIKW